MNVTPSRHTVALNLDNFFSSFVIYFDNKRYIFESLIICGIMLWSPIFILSIGSKFFFGEVGEEQRDGVTYWWPATRSVILSEIRYCYIYLWPCDNRWPVVNHYFVPNVLISKTNMFLDKEENFFFFKLKKNPNKRDGVTYTIVKNYFFWS